MKAEDELPEVRDGILEVMDEDLISLTRTGGLMALYSKMKGDYYRYAERVVAIPVPQIMEEIMEVIRLVSQERIHERIVEETIDVPFSRVMEEAIEVEKLKSQFSTLLADKKQASKLNGGCAAQAPEWKELRGLRDEELVTIRDINKLLNDCDELILKWLNFVKGVVDSEELPLNISRETLQNKILRVTMKNHADKCLDMFDEIAEQKDDCKMFYEQLVKYMKLEIAELLRSNTSKPGDEGINFKEYGDRMKEGQDDIYDITGKSIAVVSSSSFRENLRKRIYEVLYMADPVDEFAVQQSKEFDGKTVKFTPEDRLDLGEHDEKNKLEELKAKFKSLMRLLKEVIGDQVEKVNMSDRIVDLPCDPTTSKYGWSANMQRITQQRDSSPQQQRDNQPRVARQSARQERGKERGERRKERKGEGERGRSEQEEKGREERESVRKGGRGKEEEKEAEEGGDEQVEKDVTGWTEVTRKKRRKTVQIFVKVNGSDATPMEVNLTDDKVEDLMRQIQREEDVYVTLNGKVLRRDEKLKSCGVSDGCTIQVTSRIRGGGRHKDKKSKAEKKQVTRQEPVRNEGPVDFR